MIVVVFAGGVSFSVIVSGNIVHNFQYPLSNLVLFDRWVVFVFTIGEVCISIVRIIWDHVLCMCGKLLVCDGLVEKGKVGVMEKTMIIQRRGVTMFIFRG